MSHEINKRSSPEFNCPYCHQSQDDDIDLMNIWLVLMKQRYLILTVALCVMISAIVYSFLTPPQYKVKMELQEVNDLDLVILNETNPARGNFLKPRDVFSQVIENLQSKSLKTLYIKEIKKEKHPETPSFHVLNSLKVNVKRAKSTWGVPQKAIVSVLGENSEGITDLLNSYVLFVHNYTLQQIITELEKQIHDQIDIVRKIAALERINSIIQLKEAYLMASKLQIINPIGDVPFYLRGTKALEEEITSMQQRENDDPFIDELPVLQESFARLSSMEFGTSSIRLVDFEKSIIPKEPVTPKKNFLVALGIIGGLSLGVFLGFLKSFMARRTDQSA